MHVTRTLATPAAQPLTPFQRTVPLFPVAVERALANRLAVTEDGTTTLDRHDLGFAAGVAQPGEERDRVARLVAWGRWHEADGRALVDLSAEQVAELAEMAGLEADFLPVAPMPAP